MSARQREFEETEKPFVELISREINRVDFWDSRHYQKQLHNQIARHLFENLDIDGGDVKRVADRLVDLARENKHRLVQ